MHDWFDVLFDPYHLHGEEAFAPEEMQSYSSQLKGSFYVKTKVGKRRTIRRIEG